MHSPLVIVMVFAACAYEAEPPQDVAPSPQRAETPSQRSPTSTEGQQVVVRMATDGEFPSPPPPPVVEGRRHNDLYGGCDEKSGPVVNAYYAPVVAFAREHLLGKEEKAELRIHAFLVEPGTATSHLPDGVNIFVEPRGALGELRIAEVGPPFYRSGEQWVENGYCLHVVQAGRTTTIAVERAWSWIR